MAELRVMMDAITKLTEAVTGMPQREMANLTPPGLERKKVDVRFMNVQEFDGNNEEWDACHSRSGAASVPNTGVRTKFCPRQGWRRRTSTRLA